MIQGISGGGKNPYVQKYDEPWEEGEKEDETQGEIKEDGFISFRE
jgi:hypothetical protein